MVKECKVCEDGSIHIPCFKPGDNLAFEKIENGDIRIVPKS